jgi:hypothetical protein
VEVACCAYHTDGEESGRSSWGARLQRGDTTRDPPEAGESQASAERPGKREGSSWRRGAERCWAVGLGRWGTEMKNFFILFFIFEKYAEIFFPKLYYYRRTIPPYDTTVVDVA